MKMMKDFKDKIQTLEIEKQDLKQILINKGFDMTSVPLSEYHTFFDLSLCDYYVSTNGNNNNDGLTPKTPFLTLYRVMDFLNSGDKIGILPGIYTGAENCDLNIQYDCNIYGTKNTIFDGEQQRQSGWPLEHTINIKNITFKNGKGGLGGGIANHNSGTISDCIFINNQAETDGGGISNQGTGNINNCIFMNNHSSVAGGGLSNYLTGKITDCTFIGNTAEQGGGAVLNQDKGLLSNNDFYATTSTNILCFSATTIDNTYWNTTTPTETDYKSDLASSTVTNNRTTPNHPERITS